MRRSLFFLFEAECLLRTDEVLQGLRQDDTRAQKTHGRDGFQKEGGKGFRREGDRYPSFAVHVVFHAGHEGRKQVHIL